MRFPHIIRPPVALAPHHRYRPENQQHRQQPRSAELIASNCMAQSDSEPCTQRQLATSELQQPAPEAASCATALEERAPAAGKSEYQAPPPAETRPEQAEAEKTKKAAEGGCCSGEAPSRRPAEESARERLKRHRTEMAGRVRIPDMWGQERLLKDWVDCAVFDRPLAATAGLLNARDALVAECVAARRPAGHGATGRPLRVQNGCS